MQPVGGLDQLDDLLLPALQRLLHLAPGDHRERRHGDLRLGGRGGWRLAVVGHRGHRRPAASIGEAAPASAMPTSTSRGPS